MGRVFYSATRLGYPFASIREIGFVLTSGRRHHQKSPRPKIVCILEGDCDVVIGRDYRQPMAPGDLIILPTPCHHFYQSKARKQVRVYAFTLFFHPSAPLRAPAPLRPGPEREMQEIVSQLLAARRHIPRALTPTLTALIRSFRLEHDEALPGWQVRLEAISRSFLVELWRQISAPKRPPPVRQRNKAYAINEVKEFLEKSRDLPVTLAQAAWHVHWSEEHLARTFKKETGVTVMDYLRTLRIDAARLQLLSTSLTVSAIASGLRFSSTGNFCRAFKGATGQTPSQFRESHAGKSTASLAPRR